MYTPRATRETKIPDLELLTLHGATAHIGTGNDNGNGRMSPEWGSECGATVYHASGYPPSTPSV